MKHNNELLHDLAINKTIYVDNQPLKKFRFIHYLLSIVVLSIFIWTAWQIWDTRPVEVSTVVVRAEITEHNAVNTILSASGYITAKRQASVSSKITGKISEILIEEGMKVEKGQVLARLDDRIIQAELNLNKAEYLAAKASLIELEVELKYALRQFHRFNDLFDKKSIGVAELDKANVDVNILKSRKERLKREINVSENSIKVKRQALENTVIRAPFSGVIISKDAQPGEMISPMSAGGGDFIRTGLFTIVDMESLEIEVDINENYINRIIMNQSATATLSAYPDWRIPASVIAIVPAADRHKATVKVKLALEEQNPRIFPDLGVKVNFHEDLKMPAIASKEFAILIPKQALQPNNQSDQVYVIVNNRVHVRNTEFLSKKGEWLRVSSGVKEGDQVIISSSRKLRSGELVTVKN